MEVFTYVIIGLLSGLFMGTIGIGGASIVIPLLIKTGFSFMEALTLTLVIQLLPTSLLGVYEYRKHIRIIPTLIFALGSFFGIYAGSLLVTKKVLSEKTLYKIFTVTISSISILYIYRHFILES